MSLVFENFRMQSTHSCYELNGAIIWNYIKIYNTMATFKLYLHIYNWAQRDFAVYVKCVYKSLAVENGTAAVTAHTHRSLLEVSQIRDVAPTIKIHHSSQNARCSREKMMQIPSQCSCTENN